jgi:hypothetical protein
MAIITTNQRPKEYSIPQRERDHYHAQSRIQADGILYHQWGNGSL